MRAARLAPNRVAQRVGELARAGARADRAHGGGRLRAAVRAQRLRRRHGFEIDESLGLGLLDPRVPGGESLGHVSKHRALEVQRRLNPEALSGLTEDKAIFYRYCEAAGVPVPRLYAVIAREGAGWSRSGRIISRAADWQACVEEDLPDEFIVKPSLGYHGLGVMALRRSGADGALVDGAGRVMSATAVYDRLRADPRFASFVVQERLTDGPAMAGFGDGRALQTLRIVTLVRRSRRVDVIAGLLKLSLGGGDVDNFRGGATGNALVEIDVPDGRLGQVQTARADGCGLELSPLDPATGERIEGRLLPPWTDACALVTDAARHLLPIRTIGWDVAVTARGPVVIEANMWWDPFGPRSRAIFDDLLADA